MVFHYSIKSLCSVTCPRSDGFGLFGLVECVEHILPDHLNACLGPHYGDPPESLYANVCVKIKGYSIFDCNLVGKHPCLNTTITMAVKRLGWCVCVLCGNNAAWATKNERTI